MFKLQKFCVPKGRRMALALGRLPSNMIMHIISVLKWGAEVQRQADAFRDTCARAASPMSRVAVQFSRKADYEKRRSYFSIFVSLLRVMHAGQPSNLGTLLQSQSTSGLRARSFTVCARTVKVHLSAQGAVQYICAWPGAL